MSKILKNTTGSIISISDTGVSIPASPGQYVIPATDYSLWAASSDVLLPLSSGDLLFNDGSNDYDGTSGFDLSSAVDILKDMQNQFVDTSTNGLVDVIVDGFGVKRLAIDIGASVTEGDLYDCPSGVAVNDAVYISSSDTVDQAISNNTSKKYAIGIVISKPSTITARVKTQGKTSGFSGLTTGSPIFLSDSTLGGVTQTPPAGSGKWLQILGMATAVDTISLEIAPPIKRI